MRRSKRVSANVKVHKLIKRQQSQSSVFLVRLAALNNAYYQQFKEENIFKLS